MSQNGAGGTAGIALEDLKASKLRDVAYSANVDTAGATKKADLVDRLHEAGVTFGADGWTKDGEAFEVEARPSGSGPSDKTVLYAFQRAETTDDLLDRLEGALADTDYVVQEGETESGKETWSVVLPAGAQQADEQGDDEETFTCAGTTANGEPCTREVPSEGDFCHQHGEE